MLTCQVALGHIGTGGGGSPARSRILGRQSDPRHRTDAAASDYADAAVWNVAPIRRIAEPGRSYAAPAAGKIGEGAECGSPKTTGEGYGQAAEPGERVEGRRRQVKCRHAVCRCREKGGGNRKAGQEREGPHARLRR